MPSAPAYASKIPLGINSRHGIFVQQIWQGTTPLLCLANRTDKDESLQVSQWPSRQVPVVPLIQWEMAAGSTRCHDASALAGDALLEFRLVDGQRLGLMRAVREPLVENPDPAAASSFQGPNGVCPTPGTWLEQPDLWLKGGQPASLTLLTHVRDAAFLIEFPVDSGLDLPSLLLKGAASSSLAVDDENQRVTIRAGERTDVSAVHQVQLNIEVPEVTQPTMYVLSGRKRIGDSGWQCFVRGVLVAP